MSICAFQDYPLNPPKMRFISKIFHPNIYPDGRVCISILHKPGGTAELPDDTPASECWRPILNIEAIVAAMGKHRRRPSRCCRC